MYAVWGKRARLDKLGVDASGVHFAEMSMGRSFEQKETFYASTHHLSLGSFFSIDDTWESYKTKREERRAKGRRSDHINKAYRELLEPLGLKVNVYTDEIRIQGKMDEFEQLLANISEADSSALGELLS